MNQLLKLARDYVDSGTSVIPLRLDGSKAPTIEWKEFQHRLPNACELESWFSQPAGIGLVCGAISGGLEVLDFDAGDLLEPWQKLALGIATKLPIVSTPSGGWHVLYRCNEIGGNVKIACDPNNAKQTLIETRGEGGYIVAEGSPCETHATGLPYVQDWGPRLPAIPTVTLNERRQLWAAARTFDLRGEEFQRKLIGKQTQRSLVRSNQIHPVIAKFDAHDHLGIDSHLPRLDHSRWEHWLRPGKRFGVSARIVIAQDGSELLTVFSGNAGCSAQVVHTEYGANSTHGRPSNSVETSKPHSSTLAARWGNAKTDQDELRKPGLTACENRAC